MGVDLLKHNQEAFQEINKMIESGIKKIAIPRATGSGKTYLVGALAEQYNNERKLVLEPTRPLLDSIKEKFNEFGITNTDFITYQKLIRMSDEDIAAMDYKVIFLDEAHHGTAPVWGMKIDYLMKTHSDSIILGTSATTVRNDGVNVVEALFENNAIDELPLSTAIARKVLPCPHYITAIYRLDDEFEKLKKRIESATNTKSEKKEFYKKMQEMKLYFEKSYGVPFILNKYIKVRNGKYLVFCKDKKHLNAMRDVVIDWFHTAGIKDVHSYAVYSDYPDKEKDYKDFCDDKSDTLKILFTINMLNEGLHIKDISGVLMLRTTRSNLIYFQQLGRLLEAGNMDKYLLVFDFVNNFSSVNDGVGLLREIKDVIAREKESDPDFDDSGFEDIDTYFVLDQILDVQEMFKEIEGRLEGKEWTEEEDEIFRKYYSTEGTDIVNRLVGRTRIAIQAHASKLGINFLNAWTEEEIEVLKKWYPIEGGNVVNRLNRRTKGTVYRQAKKLGLMAYDDSWTTEEIEILKKYYLIERTKVGERLKSRTKEAIKIQARKLGLSINSYKPWTKEDIEILKKYYPIEGLMVANRLEGRTKKAIQAKATKLSLLLENKWTDKEIEILIKYYPIEGIKIKEKLNDRTESSIYSMVSKLKIQIPTKWTDEEYQILYKYYPTEGIKVKKKLNDKTKSSIYSMVRKLGIKTSDKLWTEEENDILKKWYPVEGSKVIDRLSGRTKHAILVQAGRLDLKFKRCKKYKYVYRDKGKYVVQFYVNGRIMRFGSYDSEDEAGKVAMEKAKEYGKSI